MKIEFNHNNEIELNRAAVKIQTAIYKLKVKRASKITLKSLNIRAANKLHSEYGIINLAHIANLYTKAEFRKLTGVGPALVAVMSNHLKNADIGYKAPKVLKVPKVTKARVTK